MDFAASGGMTWRVSRWRGGVWRDTRDRHVFRLAWSVLCGAVTVDRRSVMRKKYPLLKEAVARGLVWVEDRCYVGRAFDYVVVVVGSVGDEQGTERYLSAHPTPYDW